VLCHGSLRSLNVEQLCEVLGLLPAPGRGVVSSAGQYTSPVEVLLRVRGGKPALSAAASSRMGFVHLNSSNCSTRGIL